MPILQIEHELKKRPEASESAFLEKLTPQEILAWQKIVHRKVKLSVVDTCGGPKTVTEQMNRRNVHKPTCFKDINPQLRQVLMIALRREWNKFFINRQRERVIQLSTDICFPLGTRYSFNLIVDLMKEGVRFVSPFKGFLSLDNIEKDD